VATATRVIIAFVELAFDSGVQRYCTSSANTTWNGSTWIGGARFLSIAPKKSTTTAEATEWELTFSAIPIVLVSQALQEPIGGRAWRMWVNEFSESMAFVATLHSDAGIMDTASLEDDEGTLQ
jgi:hypothetical protein